MLTELYQFILRHQYYYRVLASTLNHSALGSCIAAILMVHYLSFLLLIILRHFMVKHQLLLHSPCFEDWVHFTGDLAIPPATIFIPLLIFFLLPVYEHFLIVLLIYAWVILDLPP